MKKLFKKKPLMIAIGVFLVIFFATSGGSSSPTPEPSPEPTPVVEKAPENKKVTVDRKPVVKKEETTEPFKDLDISPSTVLREVDYAQQYYEYSQKIVDGTNQITELMKVYDPYSQGWITDVAIQLYMVDENSRNIENMTDVPSYFQDEHDKYLRNGIAPLKDFNRKFTKAVDNLDVDLLSESIDDMQEYTKAFRVYVDFVTARLDAHRGK